MTFVLPRHASAVVVEGYILAQYSTVVPQSIRETAGGGIQQNRIGIECCCIDKEHVRVKFFDFLGQTVDDAHACSFAFGLVVDHRMHYRIRADGQVARLKRPRNGGRVGTEVASKRTSSLA